DRERAAGDRDAGLPRRDELARETAAPRLRVELERDRHLPDRAVRADGEHDPRRVREVLAGRDVQAGRRLAQVAQLDAVATRQLGQLRIVGNELVQAVLDVEALRDRALQQVAPGRREAPALRRD